MKRKQKRSDTAILKHRMKDEVIAAIVESMGNYIDKVPDGFHRLQHWCAKWKMPKNTAIRWIRMGVQNKVLEKKMFRVMKSDNTTCSYPHWRLIKHKKLDAVKKRRQT